MLRKFLKLTHTIPLIDKLCAFTRRSPDLSTLPTEILELIFSYLTPQSLVTIREIGVKRLTEISLSMKVADFSQCNTVLSEDLSSFFTEDRVENIREINFDNVFFIKPVILEKSIIKCKHLRVLSVIECGLSYANILCILKSCSELEELYWSLCIKKTAPRYEEEFENIKKLYLSIKEPEHLEYVAMTKILEMCPKAHDVCLNFSPYFSRTLPHDIARSVYTGKIFFKDREHPVSIVTTGGIRYLHDEARLIMYHFSSVYHLEREDVFRNDKNMSIHLSNFSSYLQFITDEVDMANLSSLSDNSVHSLILIMNDSKAQLLNHIEKIKKITGLKLEHLTLHNTSAPLTLMDDNDQLYEVSGGAFMCDILSQIASSSLNINVLNLSELHYDIPFPFPILYCLKRLKVLSFSACMIKDPAFEPGYNFEEQLRGFSGLVENCKDVENFAFHGCLRCHFGPDDRALADVYKWKRLKAFALTKIDTFRLCPFLRNIANNCPDFQSLELIEVGELSVCHYINNVIHILRKSKNLFFLRINQPRFYPANTLFWKALESAVNLQGICIKTGSESCVENKIITDSLKKLPFLHLCHMSAPRMCQNLPSQIKQIIVKNEVQTYDIQVAPEKHVLYKECNHLHFPTI